MKKLIDCIAVAEDGKTWFNTRANMSAWQNANPHSQVFAVGNRVTIYKEGLLTTGTKGTLKKFDRNSAGNILAHVHWLEGAPPLRVTIDSLIRTAPKKFWMVVPFNPVHANQHNSFNSSARQMGISPAVTRFGTEEAAIAYIDRERRSTGFNDYVLLESVGMFTPQGRLRSRQ